MKVGILFHCQHRMLADVLRMARPDLDVIDYDIGSLAENAARQEAGIAALAQCDVVLSLHLDHSWGTLATDTLTDVLPRTIILPGFGFAGFHPDTVYVRTSGGYLPGFTHYYHSRIALAGFLDGRTALETAELFNALVMGRAGYLSAFEHERMLVCQSFERFGIDLKPHFDRWMERGCFMHSVDHPKGWCYADVALALLQYAGLVDRRATLDPAGIADGLRFHPTHPVLSPLARRLGVPAENSFKPSHPNEEHAVTLDRFIELEFECFAGASRSDLEAAPGVATLRAVLA